MQLLLLGQQPDRCLVAGRLPVDPGGLGQFNSEGSESIDSLLKSQINFLEQSFLQRLGEALRYEFTTNDFIPCAKRCQVSDINNIVK